jgi:hypothetical protein
MKARIPRNIDAALGIVAAHILSWASADEAMRIEAETDRLVLSANPDAVVVRHRSLRLEGGLSRQVPIHIAAWNFAPPLR